MQFRADKTGIVQCTIGRASFTPEQLRDNLVALLDALNKSKPREHEGHFSEEGVGVEHDGGGREGRPGLALGAGAVEDFGLQFASSCCQRP